MPDLTTRLLAVLVFLAAAPVAWADTPVARASLPASPPPVIHSIRPNSPTVSKYGKLELTIDLSATFDNPFDPDQISVDAQFDGPGGARYHVSGFYWQDFARPAPDSSDEQLTEVGPPQWKVRFAPPRAGDWTATVSVKDRTGSATSRPANFHVTQSSDRGFLRVCSANRQYLAFDDDTPYFPVGRNMASGRGGAAVYARQFADLSAEGGNWARVWMAPWMGEIELMPRDDAEAAKQSLEADDAGISRSRRLQHAHCLAA